MGGVLIFTKNKYIFGSSARARLIGALVGWFDFGGVRVPDHRNA